MQKGNNGSINFSRSFWIPVRLPQVIHASGSGKEKTVVYAIPRMSPACYPQPATKFIVKAPKSKTNWLLGVKFQVRPHRPAAALWNECLTTRIWKNLGIEGYPPERSIYASVLHATGIHVVDTQSGKWKFQAPPKKNKMNLTPCWAVLEETIFSHEAEKIPLDVLFDKLAQAPYGLPHGIHPILFYRFLYFESKRSVFIPAKFLSAGSPNGSI